MAVQSLLLIEWDLLSIIKLLAHDQSLYINPNYTTDSHGAVNQLQNTINTGAIPSPGILKSHEESGSAAQVLPR